MCTGLERHAEAFAEYTQAGINRILSPRTAVSSAIPEVKGPQQPMPGIPALVERPAPSSPATPTARTAGVGVLSEPTMGDNGFASFSRDVQAIEANMLHTQLLLRQATAELQARQRLIEHYRRKDADHERLIGKLLNLLNNDDLDGARNLAQDKFDAIHGPRE